MSNVKLSIEKFTKTKFKDLKGGDYFLNCESLYMKLAKSYSMSEDYVFNAIQITSRPIDPLDNKGTLSEFQDDFEAFRINELEIVI